MSRRPMNGRHPRQQQQPPQPPQPQPTGTPCAELVVRFKDRLANDPVPEDILADANDEDEIQLWKKLNPTVKAFRQADMAIQGSTLCIQVAGSSQHFFHWDDVESVEAVPGKIEVVAG